MPVPPPHTEPAAAPALTPGERRVLDHRSSLWEAVPVAGAAVLSSARMSPLGSGMTLEESFCEVPVKSPDASPQFLRGSTWVPIMDGCGGTRGTRSHSQDCKCRLGPGQRGFCPPCWLPLLPWLPFLLPRHGGRSFPISLLSPWKHLQQHTCGHSRRGAHSLLCSLIPRPSLKLLF